VFFLQFSALAHIWRANCADMVGNIPEQPANRNC